MDPLRISQTPPPPLHPNTSEKYLLFFILKRYLRSKTRNMAQSVLFRVPATLICSIIYPLRDNQTSLTSQRIQTTVTFFFKNNLTGFIMTLPQKDTCYQKHAIWPNLPRLAQ